MTRFKVTTKFKTPPGRVVGYTNTLRPDKRPVKQFSYPKQFSDSPNG